MLPNASKPCGPIKLFDFEHQSIALVFGRLSGRIPVSPNRAAIPSGRADEGAVKRGLPGFRVLSFSVHALLVVWLFVASLPAPAQTTSDESKPKEYAKREE